MANTLQLRNRIRTAQNVSKTTKAMQMIAASKLKRAQDAALRPRPYVEKLSQLSRSLSSRLNADELHEYMKSPEAKTTLYIVISPDKGLCGGLITNLVKELITVSDRQENQIFLNIGKKTDHVVVRLNKELVASFPFGNTLPDLEMIYPIERIVNDYFLNQKANSVKIIYTHFTSFFSQVPKIATLLPIKFTDLDEDQKAVKPLELFEPSISAILPGLLEHYLQMNIYQYLLESFLSEQAARMFAMQNATNNANDIISELKLEYNKVRQASITNEILDITGASLFTQA